MTAQHLAVLAQYAPNPGTITHNQSNGGAAASVGYSCHLAMMHWAFMALNCTGAEANAAVSRIFRAYCANCVDGSVHDRGFGNGIHAAYGQLFCKEARPVADNASLYKLAEVGDVLITGPKEFPAHSMVVSGRMCNLMRVKRVMVRGFNNLGTLGTGEKDAHDMLSHNVMDDRYWRRDPAKPDQTAQTKFGMAAASLSIIKHADFIERARTALILSRVPRQEAA